MTLYTNIGGGLGIFLVAFTSCVSASFISSFGRRSYLLFVVTVVSVGLLFWVALFIFLRLIPLTSCHVVGLVFSVMSSSIASCGGDCGTQLVLMVWK
jgi:hypothetical protein